MSLGSDAKSKAPRVNCPKVLNTRTSHNSVWMSKENINCINSRGKRNPNYNGTRKLKTWVLASVQNPHLLPETRESFGEGFLWVEKLAPQIHRLCFEDNVLGEERQGTRAAASPTVINIIPLPPRPTNFSWAYSSLFICSVIQTRPAKAIFNPNWKFPSCINASQN